MHPDRPGPLILGLDFMPWSHSLLTAGLVMAAALAIGEVMKRRRLGIGLGLAFASHWVCDALVHTPDVPLGWSRATIRVGTSLWNWPVAAFAVEIAWLALATAILLQGTSDPRVRKGVLALAVALGIAQILASFSPGVDVSMWVLAAVAEASFAAWTVAAWNVERRSTNAGGPNCQGREHPDDPGGS